MNPHLSQVFKNSLAKSIERRYKKVNVWKRPTQYLIDIIGSSGTFQVGHYDNKHLEIYEYNTYIRGRLRSPYLNKVILTFQPYAEMGIFYNPIQTPSLISFSKGKSKS